MKNVEIKINNLKNRIKQVASEETARPTNSEKWSFNNPLWGHCALVAVIFQNKFGGKIMRGIIAENGFSHYWNKLDDKEYDLTREQFKSYVHIIDPQECTIERILSNPDTLKRYELLLEKLKAIDGFDND